MIQVPQYGHTSKIKVKNGRTDVLWTSPSLPVAVKWLSPQDAWAYVHSSSLNPPGFGLEAMLDGFSSKRLPELFPSYEAARSSITFEFAQQAKSYVSSRECIISTCYPPNHSNTMVHVPEVYNFPDDFRAQYAFVPTSGVAVALGLGAHVVQGYNVLQMHGIPFCMDLDPDDGGLKQFGGVSALDMQHAAVQLAAGNPPALEQLALNIVELKDVPQSMRGVVDFTNFVCKIVKGGVRTKTAITAIAGAYLTYKYGISPTVDFVSEYLTSLRDQLVKARGVLDSLHLRAFDAFLREDEAKQRYLQWVANREAQQKAYEYRKALRKKVAERDKAREAAKRALFKRRRRLLRDLRDATDDSIEALRREIAFYEQDAHKSLVSLGLQRDTIYEMMDEFRTSRETMIPQLWDLVVKAREGRFTAWQELKAREHQLTWLFHLQINAGEMSPASLHALLSSSLCEYERAYHEADSNLVSAEAELRDFDVQISESYADLTEELSHIKDEQQGVASAAWEKSQELRQHLQQLRLERDRIQFETDLLHEREDNRIGARLRRARSRRARWELLVDTLSRIRHEPTRHYSLKSLFVSSRRRLSGTDRGDDLTPQAVQEPLCVSYEATINSAQGECLGACINRTFEEHLYEIIVKDVRTRHDHLIYRQWQAAQAFSACLDSVGRVIDYLYTAVQPITTMWNLVPFSFVADWGVNFSTVTKNLESIIMAAASDAQPTVAWDVHKLTPIYGDNWSSLPEPLSVEVQWIDRPDSFRRTHKVRITLKAVSTDIVYRAAENCCVLRYPFPMSGVGAIIPPVTLGKFFDHVLEIGALVATITK